MHSMTGGSCSIWNSYPTTISTFCSTMGSSGTVDKFRRRRSLGCWRMRIFFVWVGSGSGGSTLHKHNESGLEQPVQTDRSLAFRSPARRSPLAMLLATLVRKFFASKVMARRKEATPSLDRDNVSVIAERGKITRRKQWIIAVGVQDVGFHFKHHFKHQQIVFCSY